MSTRCNIVLRAPQGACIWIYRHCDGYPGTRDGVLQMLWNVRLSISAKHYDYSDKVNPDWKQKWIGTFARHVLALTDSGGDLRHEITAGPHSDIDYLYVVDFHGHRKQHDEVMSDAVVRVSEKIITELSEEDKKLYKRTYSSTGPSLADAEAREGFKIDDAIYKWKSLMPDEEEEPAL